MVGDLDYWRLDNVPAGSRLWAFVDTGGTQPSGFFQRNSMLTLFDGTTEIERDDDDGTGNGGDTSVETVLASVIAGPQLTSGHTYYLQVKHFDSGTIGKYTLSVVVTTTSSSESEDNNTRAVADTLTDATTRVGVILGRIDSWPSTSFANPDPDPDYYSIVANPGEVIFVALDGDPERDGVGTNVNFDLYRSGSLKAVISGRSSANDPKPGEGLSFTATSSQKYFVRVSRSSPGVNGTYSVMAAVHRIEPYTPDTVTSGHTADFYTLSPCRVYDSRTARVAPLNADEILTIPIGGLCGIPMAATAVALNLTVVNPTGDGSLAVWPGNLDVPDTTALSFRSAVTRASNTVVGLAADGFADLAVQATLAAGGTYHFVVDVTGYFE